MGLIVRGATLRADGFFDARGTLGLDHSVPVGIQDVVVTVDIGCDAVDHMPITVGNSVESPTVPVL